MNVWALFSEGTAEKIIIASISHREDEKGLLIRTTISDGHLKDCAERSILTTYNYLLTKYPSNKYLLNPISICVIGFSGKVTGNSSQLAYSVAFISYLIEQGILKTSGNMPVNIAATGTFNDKLQTEPVSGLKYKIIAAQSKDVEILFFPSENSDEVACFQSNSDELQDKAPITKLIPVSTLEDILIQLDIQDDSSIKTLSSAKEHKKSFRRMSLFTIVLIVLIILFSTIRNPSSYNVPAYTKHENSYKSYSISNENPPLCTTSSTPSSTVHENKNLSESAQVSNANNKSVSLPTQKSRDTLDTTTTPSLSKNNEPEKDSSPKVYINVEGNQNTVVNGQINIIYKNK